MVTAKEWNAWLTTVNNFYKQPVHSFNSSKSDNGASVSNIPSIPSSLSVNAPVSENSFPLSVSPLLDNRRGDNRPFVSVCIYNEYISAMLDSGSNVSILGSPGLYLLKKFNLNLNYDISVHLTTADGQVQSTLGYVWLPTTLLDHTRSIKFLVVPSISHKIILGMDFMREFNLNINFGNSSFDSSVLSSCVVNAIQDVDTLSSQQKTELEKVINSFEAIGPKDKLGRTHVITHHIDTGDSKPIRQRQYPLSPAMLEILNKEIDNMLSLGVIRPLDTSPWLSPLWVVAKKDDSDGTKNYRVVLDSRKLNSVTVPDSYPMPLIDTIISKVRDAKYLSSIDLKQAFFQIPLDEESQIKTAFAIQNRGLFCYRSLPFGLNNSAQSMCRLMDMIIGPVLEPYVFYYLDDIIVVTPDFPTHLAVLKQLHKILKNAGLTVNFDKCRFCRPSLKFLGFVVDKDGLHTDPSKIDYILNYPVPTNTTQIRRLIGIIGYYRRFLKDFSSICSPISDLLKGRKKGQSIVWTKEADEAFDKVKKILTTTPVLASPDFTKKFFIACDASNTGVGAVLFQEEDGLEHPIAYFSKTLNKCQRKYTTTEKELLAIVLSIEKYRPYIELSEFTVITDHSSLLWLQNMKNPSPRIARWIVKLSCHKFNILHRSGKLNNVADGLSRLSEGKTEQVSILNLSSLKKDAWYLRMVENVQKFPDRFPDFKYENDILYKHVLPINLSDCTSSEWRILVPSAHRLEILKMYHMEPVGGHFGVYKTLARISELYYWPKMRRSVLKYVRKCKICASCKSSNLPQAGLMGQYRSITSPFQLISFDLLGPYPRSKKGNRYVLVTVDWFTKFVLVHPMPQATTKNIVNFIENQVFLLWGVPQICAADNGVQFVSKEFKALMKKYNVQKVWYNARYFPQINHTERVNKVLTTCIRSFIRDSSHKNWDENLHQVAQAIRLSKHEVTGFTPAYLTFMRNVPTDGSYFGQISDNANNKVEIHNKVLSPDTPEHQIELFDLVQKRLRQSYETSAQRYNLRRRDVKFKIGDRVWKKNFVLSRAIDDYAAKLAPKYVPCIVNRVISPLVYELKNLEGNIVGNFHVQHLKLNVTDDTDSETESEH